MAINDNILKKFGGSWDMPPDAPDGWENNPDLTPERSAAEKLVKTFDDNNYWGWKDPRSSLTTPFWNSILPDLKVLVCVRNPCEVAESLNKRTRRRQQRILRNPVATVARLIKEGVLLDRIKRTTSKLGGVAQSQVKYNNNPNAFNFNLWLVYNQRLLEDTPPENRLVTHYESYFKNPQTEIKRVCDFLGLSVLDEKIQEASGSINLSLRRNIAEDHKNRPEIPEEVTKLYDNICKDTGPVFQQETV